MIQPTDTSATTSGRRSASATKIGWWTIAKPQHEGFDHFARLGDATLTLHEILEVLLPSSLFRANMETGGDGFS